MGLIFSTQSKNALEETVPDRLQKATAAMYQLSGSIKNSVGQPSLMLAFKTFKSQVMSVLEYGAEIWGNLTNTQCRNFEKLTTVPEKRVRSQEANNSSWCLCRDRPDNPAN